MYNGYDVKAQQKCLAHLRRHFKKLIKLPGLNNQEIGGSFVNLIDEAFKNYALFQQTQNILEFFSWADEFKAKVESSINEWIGKAGGEGGFAFTLVTRESTPMVVFFRPPRDTS